MEEELLESLGLTQNESKIYETLVGQGKLSSTEISSKSGVPYGRIYQVLNSLIKKGLVTIIPDKTKKFVSTNPVSLIKYIERKEEFLKKAKEKAKQMKESYDVKEKNPVVVGFGKKAFYEINREMKNPKNYSYAIKYTSEFNPEWANNYKKETKIDIKILTRADKETKENILDWSNYFKKINKKNPMKKMENGGIAMSIIDDNEVMIGLIKSNATLLIRDECFTKIMKKMFEETYKTAEEIN